MAKLVLNDVTNIDSLSVINANFDALELELQNKVLYRNNPVGEPNTLEVDIDANAKNIYNVNNLSISGSLSIDGVVFEGLDATLLKANNLSDVADATVAATNLGLGSTDDVTHQSITIDTLQFTGGTGSQGTMSWNSDEETIDLIQNGATLQIGQELHWHCRNNTGSDIPDGTVVMATGTLGASGRITIAPYDSSVASNAKYLVGIATETIQAGTDGKVTHFGKIRGINTSMWLEGDVLYPDNSTPGALTNFTPTGVRQPIAFVISSHAQQGTIAVRINTYDENAAGSGSATPTVAFNVKPQYSTSISPYTNTRIPFDNETFDVGGYFDTTFHRFFPSVAGYYQINLRARCTGDATYSILTLYKNGTAIEQSEMATYTSTLSSNVPPISTLVYLNGTTEYLQVYIQTDATGSYIDGGFTSFSGILVKEA